MSMDTVIDLGKACGRELSEAEAARLREVGNKLNLRDDDALWPLLAAMEYQRIYYEALPEKIAGASRTIMDGMAAAAEKAGRPVSALKGDCRRTSQAHRQRGGGSTEPCFKDSVRQTGADVAVCPDLSAGLREPDALGGLPYRHRQGRSSGGGSAYALRLAYQRAVSRDGCVLWYFERNELCRSGESVAQKRIGSALFSNVRGDHI